MCVLFICLVALVSTTLYFLYSHCTFFTHKPSQGHALALTRMIEMNADMEFAYARLMMLEQEEKKVQARLEAFKELSNI